MTIEREDHLLYLPQVHGYNESISLFKTLTGTPTVASNRLRLNSASFASLSSYFGVEAVFRVQFPTATLAGQDKFIGFVRTVGGAAKVGFQINGGVLKAIAINAAGQTVVDQTLATTTMDASYVSGEVDFKIGIKQNGVFFSIAGRVVAKGDVEGYNVRGTTNARLDMGPYVQYVYNGNADKMDVAYIGATYTSLSAGSAASGGTGNSASQVQGNSASGATDSGNPVKTGGVYNSTPPTGTNGQRGDTQMDQNFNTKVVEQGMPGYERNGTGRNFDANHQVVLAVTDGAPTKDISSALEASTVAKNSAGRLYKSSGRLDSTAPSATYYVQFLDAASLPADGAVTHAIAPLKFIHVSGTDQTWDIDVENLGITFVNGLVIVLSSTEFTKTISSAYTTSTNLVG